jgi:hypothetical protein
MWSKVESESFREVLLYKEIVVAAIASENGGRDLEILHRGNDLLAPKNRKAVRRAFKYFEDVQDPGVRNVLFCFLWEKSGHPWDIPVTMTTIRG